LYSVIGRVDLKEQAPVLITTPISFITQVSKIGVFSCGPNPLTKSVSSAVENVNTGRRLPYFIHHFENFG
jgi:hypothetical protein